MIDYSKMTKVDKKLPLDSRFGFLRYCSELYNTSGNSKISDADWDEELEDLRKIDPDNDYFDEVGGINQDTVQGQKVKHEVICGSLNKSPNIDDFKKWLYSRYPADYKGSFIIQNKVDGLSLNLLYRSGKLIRALTRGDSVQGVDVTEKAKTVSGVLHSIACKEEVEVRGECYMDKKTFYSKWHVSVGGEYKNPRNYAAGKMNEKSVEKCAEAKLSFISYEVVRKEFNLESEKNEWLEQQGFTTLNASTKRTKEGNGLDKVVEAVKYYMDKVDRAGLEYDIDGVVVKLNDVKLAKSMGADSRGRKPNSNRAVKFLPREVETKLLDVEIGIGRTGVMCPIAILQPVDLDGSMIGRASLHNFGALIGTDAIKLGATVIIAKKGEIIPQILRVKIQGTKAIDIPTVCPSCGGKVEWTTNLDGDKVNLVCNNSLCLAQLNRNIEKFFTVIGVVGFGIGTITKLTEMKWENEPVVTCLSDMYWKLDNDRRATILHPFQKYEFIKSELGEKTYENLLASIKSVTEVTLPVFIESLGISHIGNSSKDIADIAPTVDDVDKLAVDDLLKIDKFGAIKANNFIDAWKERRGEIETLLKYLKIKADVKTSDKLKGKKFCFTGSFSIGRDELQKIVGDNGGVASSSVGKAVILVYDGQIQGGKFSKAQANGNQIISEDDFWKMLK